VNATADALPISVGLAERVEAPATGTLEASEAGAWDVSDYAREQVRNLIARLFVPGWPKRARQVVFSAVDAGTCIGDMCLRVGCELARQTSGRVGLVQAHHSEPSDKPSQLPHNLSVVSQADFATDNHPNPLAQAQSRLAVFQREFEFTLVHSSPLATGRSAVLGAITDGVVLVVEAGVTRKIAALKAKEALQQANARLLGVVLDQRSFPIPPRLYRRL
jgi:hypothetical protein